MSLSSYLALIIIVIIINALKSAQKKKEAEAARRMPTAKAQQPKQSAPKVQSQPIVPTPAPMPAHAHTTVHAAQPKVHEHLAAECDLLVNATPLGMTGQEEFADFRFLENCHGWVYDLVYQPRETALLAAALVCLLPVTAQADAETQPALLLSASQTLVERYNTFTVDVFLTGTPGADILPAAETHIDCDNASVEATSAGTAANSKITADGTAVTLSYYGEESAVFDGNGRFLLGTITLKAGRSGIATVTASRSVGTVNGLTDVDIPAASGFSGVCSVTIYHYSSSATEEPVGSPKTGDMGALAYCAMCAASGAGTAALWLRRRGKRG